MQFSKIFLWLRKQIINWLFPLFVYGIYFTLRRRSIKTRFRVSWIITLIIYCLYKSGRERLKRNISLIRPDLDNKEVTRASFAVAKTIARSWAAMLGNEFTTLDEIAKKLEVEGIETLLDYYHNGKKIIVTIVHVGPIDEMAGIIPIYKLRVYGPAEPVKPRWFFNFMMRLRLRFEGIISDPIEKGKVLDQAAYHLSQGRIILFAVDITRRQENGVFCRIGNAQAKFAVGAVKLALEENATIFPFFPSWDENQKLRVFVGPPFELVRTSDINKDIEINTRRLIEEVYAPYFQQNYKSWLRLLWSQLESVE